ncbi:hypothetical protein [Sanguibacter sp. 25GB23B1]|uniref:hypothetical protein n=1 Tax=unclassified Sanguibacter TaxID=2645534 RepID=UPI0032AF45B0
MAQIVMSGPGATASEALDSLLRGSVVERITVGARPLSFTAVVHDGGEGRRRLDVTGLRRIVFDPEREDHLGDQADLMTAEGVVAAVTLRRDGLDRPESGTATLVLDVFDVEITADSVQVSTCEPGAGVEDAVPERFAERLELCRPGEVLYTGLAPFSPGWNTTFTIGAGWIEVEELYVVGSFTIDITHGRVDIGFVRDDGSGSARLRFDLVTDVFVQPDRYDGISAIEESWPPPSMGMDGFDEVTLLPRRPGSLGGRFLVIVGAFDLLIEARSVWFTREERRA